MDNDHLTKASHAAKRAMDLLKTISNHLCKAKFSKDKPLSEADYMKLAAPLESAEDHLRKIWFFEQSL